MDAKFATPSNECSHQQHGLPQRRQFIIQFATRISQPTHLPALIIPPGPQLPFCPRHCPSVQPRDIRSTPVTSLQGQGDNGRQLYTLCPPQRHSQINADQSGDSVHDHTLSPAHSSHSAGLLGSRGVVYGGPVTGKWLSGARSTRMTPGMAYDSKTPGDNT